MNKSIEELKKMKFSTEKPDNYNIINNNINSLLLYEKKFEKILEDAKKILEKWWILITWAWWWIWEKIFDIWKEEIEFVPIWSRKTASQMAELFRESNNSNTYAWWNLFKEEENHARKLLVSPEIANANWSTLYIAAINPDPAPLIDENWNILDEVGQIINPNNIELNSYWNTINPETGKEWEESITEEEKNNIRENIKNIKRKIKSNWDMINPETSQKWEEWTTEKEKNNIREKMANIQIKLYKDYLDNILTNRDENNKETLNIFYYWSIANMFDFSHSQYWRLKKECSLLSEEYRIKFAQKFGSDKVNIYDLSIAMVNTNMWNDRPNLTINTWLLAVKWWKNMPIAGVRINQEKVFDPNEIAVFNLELLKIKPWEVHYRMLVDNKEKLDIKKLKKNHKEDKKIIAKEYKKNNLNKNDKWEIILNDEALDFLLKLKKIKLEEYFNNYETLHPINKEPDFLKKYAKKPKKTDLDINIERWKQVFEWLKTSFWSLKEPIFLDQAIRFLNNHI